MWQVKKRIEISLVPCAFVPACPRACVSGLITSRRCRHPVVGSHVPYSNPINQMTYICDTRALAGDSLPQRTRDVVTKARQDALPSPPSHPVSRPVNANPRQPAPQPMRLANPSYAQE